MGGLQVVDISDPTSPEIVGSVDPSADITGVAVASSYAYITDVSFSGFKVIDISTPTSPEIVGSVQTLGSTPIGVAVAGSYAYIADGFNGFQVIDISDPTSPEIVGDVDTPGNGYPKDIAVFGSHAYFADGSAGLQTIDISDPASPAIIGSVDTPGSASDVAVVGSYAYVADASPGGLQVILAPCDVTAVLESSLPAAPHAEALIRSARPFPASETAMVPFWLQRGAAVKLGIYDATGRKVRSLVDGVRGAGEHLVGWNGRDDAGRSVASGLYFARLSWPGGSSVARAAWVR